MNNFDCLFLQIFSTYETAWIMEKKKGFSSRSPKLGYFFFVNFYLSLCNLKDLQRRYLLNVLR